MTNKRTYIMRHTLLAVNAAYWLFFWGYFFLFSTQPRAVNWEGSPPFYVVLGRGFGSAVPAVFHSTLLQSCFWLNLPCWLVTWPLGYIVGTGVVAGTNAAGIRLLTIMVLSFGQWHFIGKLLGRLTDKERRLIG